MTTQRTPSNPHAGTNLLKPEMTLQRCLKCNICVSACPVSKVTDLYPGPKYEGPQAGRFRKSDQPSPDQSVDYCSGCRVCDMVCTQGVKVAEINARARHDLVSHGKVPAFQRLRNNIIARTELLGTVAQPIAPISNFFLGNPVVRGLTESIMGIAKDAPFPPFARQRFTAWFQKRTPAAEEQKTKKVAFFHGCATEYYEPRVGRAAVHVLEANSFDVLVPKQNCCGLPLLSNGEFDAARNHHERNVNSLVAYARQEIPIVGTSTSCTLTLKEEAPELLDMHDEDTRLVAEYTYDFNEFLVDLWRRGQLNMDDLKPIPLRLAYHQPCQYRAHRIGSPSMEMMNLIPDLQIVEGHADCCGIAGTYGYKKEKYDISMAVGQELFDFVAEVGGPLVVCDSETCRWQISHGTGLPSIHPVELLAASYGYEPEGALAEALNNGHR